MEKRVIRTKGELSHRGSSKPTLGQNQRQSNRSFPTKQACRVSNRWQIHRDSPMQTKATRGLSSIDQNITQTLSLSISL